MAPSSSTSQETSAKTTTTGRKRPRTLVLDVNQDVLKPNITRCSSEVESSNPAGDSSSSSSCGNTSDEESYNSNNNTSNGLEECTTPKAKECRIPAVLSCPPAPKKRRPTARHRSAPSMGFFCPPELDLLFSPLQKISKSM